MKTTFENYMDKISSEVNEEMAGTAMTFNLELNGNILSGFINNKEINIDIDNPGKDAQLVKIVMAYAGIKSVDQFKQHFGGNDNKRDINTTNAKKIPTAGKEVNLDGAPK